MSNLSFLPALSKKLFGRASVKSGPSAESLSDEIKRLERAVKDLSILNELAIEMGASVDPDEIVKKLVDGLMRAVEAEQAVVTLVDRNAHDPMKTSVRVMSSSAERPHYHLNEHLLGWMYIHKKTLLVNDPGADEQFKSFQWDEALRSIMCVPLMLRSELIGILTICNKKNPRGFTEDDERLLPFIAAQSAQVINNARLSKERAGMQEQVRLAYEIQSNLLPKSAPEIEGYDVAGTSIPAQMVGGDYFDFMPAAGGGWAICLGDVSGKGLPASLLMANLQATLRGQTLVEARVLERVERSNLLLCEVTDDERFVTLFYGVLDEREHRLTFCNAGHEMPIVVSKDGSLDRLPPGGMALGVSEQLPHEEDSVSIEPGGVVVIFSDGITDATNKKEEPFGAEALISLVKEHRKEPAAILVDRVIEAVNAHAGGAPQMDDLTIVVVKRTG
ncbi:MAG: GAF domain-containing SpoIIE family protein phosphatase [Candidatus Krumholzibacteria bacterium]